MKLRIILIALALPLVACSEPLLTLDESASEVASQYQQEQNKLIWYTPTELHKSSLKEWQAASKSSKRSLCADYLMALQMRGWLVASEFGHIEHMNQLKPYAEQLATAVNKNVKADLSAQRVVNSDHVATEILRAAGQLGYLTGHAQLGHKVVS
ncbi:hypothetical protein [Salinimonas lutimaris]|uniref:hypothetical protein n=1 Tax=Salinimonas lutimaris TaxID=914153 RepID=UPI0010C06567|nr:hypothetical protein [Salinimonas lutimaris]